MHATQTATRQRSPQPRRLNALALALLLPALLSVAITPPTAGAMDMEPVWIGTPFLEAWIPENADVVRGVLVLNGWPFDARWYEAAAYWKFAIVRINTDQYTADLSESDPDYPALQGRNVATSKALVHAMRVIAERTGHPEINHAPIVATGFSRFSSSAQLWMQTFPTRALGFMNGHGGGGDPRPSGPRGQLVWQQTPSLGLQCEWENIFSGGDKTQLLNHWWQRADGTLAAAAIHWRVYHSPKTFADLGIIFIDQLIKHRIPHDWDPRTGPAQLRPVREQDGWLGSHQGWRVPVEQIFQTDNQNAQIKPFDQFKGDRSRASWLISEDLAFAWRAFSSRYPKARIIQPGLANRVLHQDPEPAPTGHLEAGVRAGEPFTVAALSYVEDMQRVEFYANTTRLGAAQDFTGGETPLGSTRGAHTQTQVTISDPGVYAIMARYTTRRGDSGWSKPLPIVVWPSDTARTPITTAQRQPQSPDETTTLAQQHNEARP